MELSLKTNCGKFLKRLSTRPPELSPKKPVCRSKSNRTLPGITEWFKPEKGGWQLTSGPVLSSQSACCYANESGLGSCNGDGSVYLWTKWQYLWFSLSWVVPNMFLTQKM